MKQKDGFSLAETLIIGSLVGGLLLVGTLLLNNERARTRDAKRIADMTRLASGFTLLYAEKASYLDAAVGCSKVRQLASTCALTEVLPGLNTVADPGRFSYTVSRVPDREDFGIAFTLERSYGALKAGRHTLSKNGIQ